LNKADYQRVLNHFVAITSLFIIQQIQIQDKPVERIGVKAPGDFRLEGYRALS
jgi:hypothetical protein